MHATSMENMVRCYNRFIAGDFLRSRDVVSILDLGGTDVNGSYKEIFDAPHIQYLAADLAPGPGVDLVLDDPYVIPKPDAEFDVIVSGQVFEHCEFFWKAFQEMVRVLKPDGVIILIAPSAGPIHRYPVDCYRFYPDAYAALAKYTDCRLEECIHDERGPWRDLCGVFRKASAPALSNAPGSVDPADLKLAIAAPADPGMENLDAVSPEENAVGGDVPYLETIEKTHQTLRPDLYLEIGIRKGHSLKLANCRSIAVDPAFDVTDPPADAQLFRQTSDDFFAYFAEEAIDDSVDLAFIDGMHLFEYAFRDFMNVERLMSPYGVVIVDDIFPNHPIQGSRVRKSRIWTGDVWRLLVGLAEHRPDLLLLPLDCKPTGLMLVAGLKEDNRRLWDRYNSIVRSCLTDYPEPLDFIRDRSIALDPNSPLVDELLTGLRELRERGAKRQEVQRLCERIREQLPFGFDSQ